MAYYQECICSALEALTAIIVLVIMVGFRRRNETYLVLTLIFFIIADISDYLGSYYWLSTGDEGSKRSVLLCFAVGNFSLLMSH